MPAFTLTMLAAVFFEKFRKSHVMLDVLTGVRPACVGMIFGVLLSLCGSNYAPGGSISLISIAMGVGDFVLLTRYKVSIPKVICLSAAVGLLLFGVLGLS